MIAERGNIGWNINKEYDGSNKLTLPVKKMMTPINDNENTRQIMRS